MTNRLPKQEPQFLNAQEFMEHHLADFLNKLVKEGMDKKVAIKWAADRFEKGGKFNLQSIPSRMMKQNIDTGEVTPFEYREGQVYQVADDDTISRGVDAIHDCHSWNSTVWMMLLSTLAELRESKVIMIWRMYRGMTAFDSEGIKIISYVGGDDTDMSGDEAELIGGNTGTIMASSMELFVNNDILELVGQASL